MYEEAIFRRKEGRFAVKMLEDTRKIVVLRETYDRLIRAEWEFLTATRELKSKSPVEMGEGRTELNIVGEPTEVC